MSAIRKVSALLAVLFLFSVCAFAAQYRTTSVENDTFEISVSGAGNITLLKYQAIAVPVQGAHIYEVFVTEGDAVSEGDVIATYIVEVSAADAARARVALEAARDDYEYEISRRDAEISELRASAETLEGDAKREAELRAERAELTRARYDESARAELAALEAAYAGAEAAAKPRELRAGMDGYMLSMIDEGDDATLGPNRTVAEIYDPDSALISVDNSGGEFVYGMSVNVRLSAGSTNVNAAGRVISADNVIPGALRTGRAYIALEPGYKKANYTSATVSGTAISISGATIVNSSAFTFSGGSYSVRVLTDDGAVRTRRVVKALENGSETWLFMGVSEGDKLILK